MLANFASVDEVKEGVKDIVVVPTPAPGLGSPSAIYGQSAAPNDTAEDAVLSLFHILNQFDIPKGSVQSSAVGGTVDEITEWTSVADLKNLRWYFRTFADQSIRMVDLKEAVAAAKGEMRTIEIEGTTQTICNASTSFVAGK